MSGMEQRSVIIDTRRLRRLAASQKISPHPFLAASTNDLEDVVVTWAQFISLVSALGPAVYDCVVQSATALARWSERRPVARQEQSFYTYFRLPDAGTMAPAFLLEVEGGEPGPQRLNRGHWEPALSFPLVVDEPIRAVWAGLETAVLEVFKSPDGWLIPDSYVEASYRAHGYYATGPRPARLASITVSATQGAHVPTEALARAELAPGALGIIRARLLQFGMSWATFSKLCEDKGVSVSPAEWRDGLDAVSSEVVAQILSLDSRRLLPQPLVLCDGRAILRGEESFHRRWSYGPTTVSPAAMAVEGGACGGLFLHFPHVRAADRLLRGALASETLIVLDGELHIEVGTERVQLGPLDSFSVRAGTDYAAWGAASIALVFREMLPLAALDAWDANLVLLRASRGDVWR